jgi:hypothetical protein
VNRCLACVHACRVLARCTQVCVLTQGPVPAVEQVAGERVQSRSATTADDLGGG